MFALYCFCLLISTVVKTEIMNPPPNVAVMEGDRVVLECGSDGTVEKWYLKRPLTSTELVIYSNTTLNRSLGGTYSINNLARNETDLVIASTTMSEAGTYYCQDYESISTAEVIVFGLMNDCNPKGNTVDSSLSTNSTNPALLGGFTSLGGTIACVSYNGQWPPTIQCSNPTEGVNRSAEILKSFPMNDSTLVVFRISNESKISRESYKCEAFFLESSRPPRASGDCPELELHWGVLSTTTSSMPRDYRASVSLLVVMLLISAWWSICIRTDQNIQ